MCLYQTQARHSTGNQEREQRKLFPEQVPLIPDAFVNSLFSGIYKGNRVKYRQKLKRKAPPVARTTDEAVSTNNAIAHVEADTTSLCGNRRRKARRAMEAREQRGLQLAANSKITRHGDLWIVPSQHNGKKYTVDLNSQSCSCPDHEATRQKCKHIFAVEYAIQQEQGLQLPEQESRKVGRPTYRQAWHEYNLAQVNEKALFQSLLYELCQIIDEPLQNMGRPRVSLADLLFCAGLKVYSTISGRRNMSDLREAQKRGYISKAVHYNTISKYLERKSLTPLIEELITRSSLPLKDVECDFTMDSTGLSTGRFVRWFDVKYGGTEDWHDWIKLHLACGVKTNIVTAVIISGRHDNDSPFFKPLLEKTARAGWKIREVSADKEYLSANNIRLVLLKGGQPYIPFKSNSTTNQKSTVWNRMLHFYRYHQEEFGAHYHKRSNVESTFSMIKAKFGERIRSKTETAQTNEALLKVLCHNICCVIQSMYELGIDVDFVVKRGI